MGRGRGLTGGGNAQPGETVSLAHGSQVRHVIVEPQNDKPGLGCHLAAWKLRGNLVSGLVAPAKLASHQQMPVSGRGGRSASCKAVFGLVLHLPGGCDFKGLHVRESAVCVGMHTGLQRQLVGSCILCQAFVAR